MFQFQLSKNCLIKNKFTFQENNKKSDKSKDILREKFKEQRMIFVENQEKWDRKINKSVEPTDSDSDINVIYYFITSIITHLLITKTLF